jgi:hypothetical protein
MQQGYVIEKLLDVGSVIQLRNRITQFMSNAHHEIVKYMVFFIRNTPTQLQSTGKTMYQIYGSKIRKFRDGMLFPFIELMLRFYDFPMTQKELRSLKMHRFPGKWKDPPDDEVDALWYGAGGVISRRYVVKNKHTKEMRSNTRKIDGQCSLYLHFYIAYCTDHERLQPREGTESQVRSVFQSKAGASIGDQVQNKVRRYCTNLGMSEKDMKDIEVHVGGKYVYNSKVIWASLTSTDLSNFQSVASTMKFPMERNKTDHYTGVEHIYNLSRILKEVYPNFASRRDAAVKCNLHKIPPLPIDIEKFLRSQIERLSKVTTTAVDTDENLP